MSRKLPAAVRDAPDWLGGLFSSQTATSSPPSRSGLRKVLPGGSDAPPPHGPGGPVLAAQPVPIQAMQVQCGDLLCWAAVIQWFLARTGVGRRQCEIAEVHFRKVGSLTAEQSCCSLAGPCGLRRGTTCDKRADLEVAMDSLGLEVPTPFTAFDAARIAAGFDRALGPAPLPCLFTGRFDHYGVVHLSNRLFRREVVATLYEPKTGCAICFAIEGPDFKHPHYDLRCQQYYLAPAVAKAIGGSTP